MSQIDILMRSFEDIKLSIKDECYEAILYMGRRNTGWVQSQSLKELFTKMAAVLHNQEMPGLIERGYYSLITNPKEASEKVKDLSVEQICGLTEKQINEIEKLGKGNFWMDINCSGSKSKRFLISGEIRDEKTLRGSGDSFANAFIRAFNQNNQK